jgi:patatin-related protein
MYGGVSLAIYINGVAQELYHLVRATGTKTAEDNTRKYLFSDEELAGAGKVYRRLGEMLNSRFVVDLLSGTSAGGINAVFLAKSLANGETFEQLKQLWIQEGDIGILINDRESGLDKEGLKFSGEPASLLNSQRMYYKLLYALDTMNPDLPAAGGAPAGRSPYVDELDLFVTATDIRGLIQKNRLAGGTTEEYRYKNVFRFRYATAEAAGGEDVNDFEAKNSPFLAFAARCTSAFPFAFEPMRLDDVKAVIEAPAFRNNYSYDPSLWKGFYRDYLQTGIPAQADIA